MSLIDHAQDIIINSTLKMLKQQDIVENEIAFLVFAYHFDFPFHPEAGLCQSSERDRLLEYGPLAVYSVGDMAYFAEPDLYLHLDAEPGAGKILDELHEDLNANYEYEAKKQLIIDAYTRICKTLMAHDEIRNYIPAADDFYVLAYDGSELNAEVYIDTVLEGKQRDELQKAFKDFEEQPPYPEEDYALFEAQRAFAAEQVRNYEDVKHRARKASTETLYATELLYFLEPYRLDQSTGVLLEPTYRYGDERLNTQRPTTDEYYEYWLEGGRINYIAHHSNEEELATETFFLYDQENQTTQYTFNKFEGTRRLDNCTVIKDIDPTHQSAHTRRWHYNGDTLSELKDSDYYFDERGHLNQARTYKTEWKHDFDVKYDKVEFKYGFEQDAQGRIAKVVKDLLGEDHVIFEADKSYLDDNLRTVVELGTQFIMSEITLDHISPISALILPNAVFTGMIFDSYFVLIKNEDEYETYEVGYRQTDKELERACHQFNHYAQAAIDSGMYMNNYLNKDEALEHIDKAYDMLAEKLAKAIKDKFKLDIPVFVGSYKLKTDAIIKLIEDEET